MFKILVPLTIVTKLLADAGVVDWLGRGIGPAMGVVGLPGSMGLVWATAMVTSLYGAMVVFAAVAPAEALTVAQVTILCTMMLVAHGLPVELRIAQKAGPRMRTMFPIRVGGAFLLGWVLHFVFARAQWLQSPNHALWNPAPQDPSWGAWALGQARNLLSIFIIIVALLVLMKLLKCLGISDLLTRILQPALRALGMSRDAAPVTIVGMTLGLTYGGGLIIREAQSGRLSKRDVFFSLALMGLCHSLIEDTLLMMLLGAHWAGVLVARLLFSLLVVFLLVRVLRPVSDAAFDRYFFRARRAAEPETSSPK